MEKDISCLITFLVTFVPSQRKENIYNQYETYKQVPYKEKNAKEEFANHPISDEIS